MSLQFSNDKLIFSGGNLSFNGECCCELPTPITGCSPRWCNDGVIPEYVSVTAVGTTTPTHRCVVQCPEVGEVACGPVSTVGPGLCIWNGLDGSWVESFYAQPFGCTDAVWPIGIGVQLIGQPYQTPGIIITMAGTVYSMALPNEMVDDPRMDCLSWNFSVPWSQAPSGAPCSFPLSVQLKSIASP